MPGLWTKRRKPVKSKLMQSVTLRDFSGGWNAVDSDEALNSKYSPVLRNWYRGTDGNQILRLGSFWFADVKDVTSGLIIDVTYFRDRLIVVLDSGDMASVTAAGVVAVLWNAAIANALPGAPAGWGTVTQVDFVPFKDAIIIHNGIDKPVTISNLYVVTYLQDLATGSNVNVPIGKYGCTVSNYHVVGGIPATPTRLYVSSIGTAGVFVGDPAPNDSISFDVGAYAPQDTEEIRGIAGFRNFLLVFFRGNTLTIRLGNYVGTVHTPQFDDTLPGFGLIGHRCRIPIENDLLFATAEGLASSKRNIFAGLIESQHLSSLIQPEYMKTVRALSDSQQKLQTFAIQDELYGQVMVHTPSGRQFVYTFKEDLKVRGWSEYDGVVWTSGCKSAQGRIFYSFGTKIFQKSNTIFDGEDKAADKCGDRDSDWLTATAYVIDDLVRDTVNGLVYKTLVDHSSSGATFSAYRAANPTHWAEYLGEPIDFDWEMPWMDFRTPENTKKLKFIKFVSKGTAEFTVQSFVDGLYKDEADCMTAQVFTSNDLGWAGYTIRQRVPASMLIVSGDRIRMQLEASSSVGTHFLKMYIGHAAAVGDVWDFAASPIQVTVGSQNSFIIPVGGTVLTDWVPFVIDEATDIIISAYIGASPSDELRYKSQTGANAYYTPGTDDAATIDTTGYTTIANRLYFVKEIITEVYIPQLSMAFVGNQSTGLGRKSNDARLYGFPVRFKRCKLRFIGSTREKLRIGSMTLLYSQGAFRRQ